MIIQSTQTTSESKKQQLEDALFYHQTQINRLSKEYLKILAEEKEDDSSDRQ